MNRAIDALSTPEETKEVELAIIQSKNLTVTYVGYQRYSDTVGVHMYDLIAPQLPQYDYSLGNPTFSLEGLRSLGLI